MSLLSLFQTAPLSSNGLRIYAVGDVHGCYTELVTLLQYIEGDHAARDWRQTELVLLGDYIDRGPRSRDVCDLLFSMRDLTAVHCLRGNHEQALVNVIDGDREALQFWLHYGGVETLASWGMDSNILSETRLGLLKDDIIIDHIRAQISDDMVEWLRTLPTHYCQGDYLFAHAGIRPGIRIDRQRTDDLLWIREPFLSSKRRHSKMIVHGHSEAASPQVKANRIGIDTSAYRSGTLTAIGIEDDLRWFLRSDGTKQPAMIDSWDDNEAIIAHVSG